MQVINYNCGICGRKMVFRVDYIERGSIPVHLIKLCSECRREIRERKKELQEKRRLLYNQQTRLQIKYYDLIAKHNAKMGKVKFVVFFIYLIVSTLLVLLGIVPLDRNFWGWFAIGMAGVGVSWMVYILHLDSRLRDKYNKLDNSITQKIKSVENEVERERKSYG